MLYAYDNVCHSNETTDVQFLSPSNICRSNETEWCSVPIPKHLRGSRYLLLPACEGYGSKWLQILAIRIVNTEVLIMAIYFFYEMKVDVNELWVDFGVRKNRCFFRIHDIYNQIVEVSGGIGVKIPQVVNSVVTLINCCNFKLAAATRSSRNYSWLSILEVSATEPHWKIIYITEQVLISRFLFLIIWRWYHLRLAVTGVSRRSFHLQLVSVAACFSCKSSES